MGIRCKNIYTRILAGFSRIDILSPLVWALKSYLAIAALACFVILWLVAIGLYLPKQERVCLAPTLILQERGKDLYLTPEMRVVGERVSCTVLGSTDCVRLKLEQSERFREYITEKYGVSSQELKKINRRCFIVNDAVERDWDNELNEFLDVERRKMQIIYSEIDRNLELFPSRLFDFGEYEKNIISRVVDSLNNSDASLVIRVIDESVFKMKTIFYPVGFIFLAFYCIGVILIVSSRSSND